MDTGERKPPVIILYGAMPDLDEDDRIAWTADMTRRGALRFVRKPFRSGGRTLDRAIKKLLLGSPEFVRLVSIPLVPITRPDVPVNVNGGCSATAIAVLAAPVAPRQTTGIQAAGAESTAGWLSVTQAARLLVRDLPGLDIRKARSRISTAAGRNEFRFTGSRKARRIEPVSFDAWRLRQRDHDLDEEDDDEA